MLLLVLLSCSSTDDVGELCTVTESSTDAVEPPVDEDELWAAIEEFSPSEILWDVTANESASSLTLEISRSDGDATSVEYSDAQTPACREGLALHVPVLAVVTIADGAASATVEAAMDAYGLEFADIRFSGIDEADGMATLSDDWEEAAGGQDEVEGEITEWSLNLVGNFDALEVSNGGSWETDEEQGSAVFWQGTVVVP